MVHPVLLLALALPAQVPDILPDAPALCEGSSVVLDAGGGFRDYTWSTGEHSRSITATPLTTTDYQVLVVDAAGDKHRANETVTVWPRPPMAFTVTPPAVCTVPGAGLEAVADASAIEAVKYYWQVPPPLEVDPPVSTSPRARITLPPGYLGCSWVRLEVEDYNGCHWSAVAEFCVFPAPQADAGPDRLACAGATVRLGTIGQAGSSHQWFPPDGLDDPTSPNPNALVSGPKTYTLVVLSPDGCSAMDSVSIQAIGPGPPEPMDNGLFLVRDGADIVHLWVDRPGVPGYRLAATAERDLGAAETVGEALAGAGGLVESGAAATPASRFYQLAGIACP